METYDVIVLGAGAGGKMIWGSVGDLSVAVVEQARVGGDCPFVACVPSKAMLRSARLWTGAAASATARGPRAGYGSGSDQRPGVEQGGPPGHCRRDRRRSGGCELAFLFATFGSTVRLVQRNARLVPREEPDASAAVADALAGRASTCACARRSPTPNRTTRACRILDDSERIITDRVVLGAGRRRRSADLGLDTLGVELPPDGAVPVDPRCQVVGTHSVWAIGDVTGIAPFTHTARYQGRVVAVNLTGRAVETDYRAVPRAVYITPTLRSVGRTVASARAAGLEPLVARAQVSQTVRANTEGSVDGRLMLLADPEGSPGAPTHRESH
jgi:pyruvate/2-oxoglutarate dehydrogenase complex dihydrolipoamide dehydrogenase (E3) component